MRKFILHGLLSVCLAFGINASAKGGDLSHIKQILFICTGNHYRSQFAEVLFNQKAREAHLNWKAVSRGLQLDPSQHGISHWARQELIKRGVPQELCKGTPKPLTKEDLAKSDYVVLMDETEHRPMLERQFPTRDNDKIHYWHIGESDQVRPTIACQEMSKDIQELLQMLER